MGGPSQPRPGRNTTTPSPAHRRSYNRRTGSERTFATIKDPATTSIARGWCRLTGLTPLTLWIACLLTVRNQRILTAYSARQADTARRAALGLPPRPASAAARPSPRSPPDRPDTRKPPPAAHRPAPPNTVPPARVSMRPARQQPAPQDQTQPQAAATTPSTGARPNARPKREHGAW